MKFFTSDLHFFHTNIIHYCKRPFADVEHMNAGLVSRWNTVVQEDDEVYVLGDVTFGPQMETAKLLDSMHGTKYLIQGNHDHKLREVVKSCFAWVKDYVEIKHNGRKVVLCHYPMRVWNNSHWGSWQLHGHSHGTLEDIGGLQLDVGVDVHNYAPISIDDVEKIMSTRSKRHEDHHHIIKDHVCPVCNEGFLLLRSECDTCGTVLVQPEQSRHNKMVVQIRRKDKAN